MSTKKPETLLVGKIMKYLGTVPNCCYEKRHGSMYSVAGEPDISACINGKRVEIEVKVPSDDKIKTMHGLISTPYWPTFSGNMLKACSAERVNLFPGNKPTELQVERLLAWERAGAVAFIAYSVDAVRYVVEKMERGEIK